jgi:hypothetical protein
MKRVLPTCSALFFYATTFAPSSFFNIETNASHSAMHLYERIFPLLSIFRRSIDLDIENALLTFVSQ